LYCKVNKVGIIFVLDIKSNRIKGLAAVLTFINREQLSLCSKHRLEFESGLFCLLDCFKLNKVFSNIPTCKPGDFKATFYGKDYTSEKKK
jgi:hypothetical protein